VTVKGKQGYEYSDGSVREANGHSLARLPGAQPITSENAHALVRLRQEKAAERLRARIFDETQAVVGEKLDGSADAVAYAGAKLWAQVVLADPSDKVYPRDRLEAWDKIGKQAGILSEQKQADAPSIQANNVTVNVLLAQAAQELLAKWAAGKQQADADE